jgi:hypothetical protein
MTVRPLAQGPGGGPEPVGPDGAHRLDRAALELALGLRWAGAAGRPGDHLDPGLGLWAGIDPLPPPEALRATWAAAPTDAYAPFQAALLRTLAAQRLLPGDTLHVYQVPVAGGSALVAGLAQGPWPLGVLYDPAIAPAAQVETWQSAWAAATGHHLAAVVVDAALAEHLAGLSGVTLTVAPVGEAISAPDPLSSEEAAHQAGRAALVAALAALDGSQLGVPEADLTIALLAAALLRLWARWLRPFADSSLPYLLDQFIRRPGRLTWRPPELLVTLEHRPLDVVLDMAGYLAPLEQVPGTNGRRVRFRNEGL